LEKEDTSLQRGSEVCQTTVNFMGNGEPQKVFELGYDMRSSGIRKSLNRQGLEGQKMGDGLGDRETCWEVGRPRRGDETWILGGDLNTVGFGSLRRDPLLSTQGPWKSSWVHVDELIDPPVSLSHPGIRASYYCCEETEKIKQNQSSRNSH
jgi:hypothetical protein